MGCGWDENGRSATSLYLGGVGYFMGRGIYGIGGNRQNGLQMEWEWDEHGIWGGEGVECEGDMV